LSFRRPTTMGSSARRRIATPGGEAAELGGGSGAGSADGDGGGGGGGGGGAAAARPTRRWSSAHPSGILACREICN
jgi:hypothetical protein